MAPKPGDESLVHVHVVSKIANGAQQMPGWSDPPGIRGVKVSCALTLHFTRRVSCPWSVLPA
jgi:hypothetical protein